MKRKLLVKPEYASVPETNLVRTKLPDIVIEAETLPEVGQQVPYYYPCPSVVRVTKVEVCGNMAVVSVA